MRKKMCAIMMAGTIAATCMLTGCVSRTSSDDAQRVAVETNPVTYDPITTVGSSTVTGEANYYQLFFFITWGIENTAEFAFSGSKFDINDIIAMSATYDACQKTGAYGLAAARYDFESRDYLIFKKVKCVTTGYPVMLTGVKLHVPSDNKSFDIKLKK